MTERMGDNLVAVRVWRRIDEHPGFEHCRLLRDGIEGDVVVDQCCFSYRVVVDAAWRTLYISVLAQIIGARTNAAKQAAAD